jgi:hypothetical protein
MHGMMMIVNNNDEMNLIKVQHMHVVNITV